MVSVGLEHGLGHTLVPQKLVDTWGTTTKGYPYEVTCKEEQPDMWDDFTNFV